MTPPYSVDSSSGWQVRTGARSPAPWVLFTLKLALLEYSHPFYKDHRLFMVATPLRTAQKGLGLVGMGHADREPGGGGRAQQWAAKLSPRRAGFRFQAQRPLLPPPLFRMRPRRPPAAGRLQPEPGLDAHFVYSSSFSILRQASWDEGGGQGGGPLGQASRPVSTAPLSLVCPAWPAQAPSRMPKQSVEPTGREPRAGTAVSSCYSPSGTFPFVSRVNIGTTAHSLTFLFP